MIKYLSIAFLTVTEDPRFSPIRNYIRQRFSSNLAHELETPDVHAENAHDAVYDIYYSIPEVSVGRSTWPPTP